MDIDGFDIIGDIHGHAGPLDRLLEQLDYRQVDGAYRHRSRQAVFVGDLIDRGPDQLAVLHLVRAMVEAGSAQIVMGNHEFNALAWATRRPDGSWSRPHSPKNRGQHAAFLEAVGEDSPTHRSWVEWFRTIPMWLDLGGVRVVHACWAEDSMVILGSPTITDDVITALPDSPLFVAAEILTKGPEVDLGGAAYRDKDGNIRRRARLAWWRDDARTLDRAAVIPGGVTDPDGRPFGPLPPTPIPADSRPEVPAGAPIIYGHYWRSGPTPTADGPATACVDWSVAKGGPLVAYRWSGETELVDTNLVASDRSEPRT